MMYSIADERIDDPSLPPGSRVLITGLESEGFEPALLSESALAADWERPEEDVACSAMR